MSDGSSAEVHEREIRYGTLAMHEVFAMSGVDFLTGVMDGRFPHPPISSPMQMHLSQVENGSVMFVSEPSDQLLNPIGSIHGGYAMTLLDSCMACAVHSTLRAGEAYITVEVKVNMVRPIQPDTGEIRAEGTVIHRGRTIATADGKLHTKSGKLLAHATTTCSIMAAPNGG